MDSIDTLGYPAIGNGSLREKFARLRVSSGVRSIVRQKPV